MSLFDDPVNDKVVTNANGTSFKYVSVDNKWIIISNVDVYSETEIDALDHDHFPNPNGNANEQHLTAAQVAQLHDDVITTNAHVDARIALANHDVLQNPNGNAEEQHMTSAQITALHPKQHVITATADHTSTATSGQILKADANGLPIDATNTDTDVASAVTLKHAQSHDNTDHSTNYKIDFSENTGFNKDFGTGSTNVCVGDDSRLSDTRDAISILTKTFTEGGGDLADDDIMVYRTATGKWELEPKPAAGSNPALNEVTDVTISAPANNEVLAYNGAGEWINQTPSEAGLAAASHTHSSLAGSTIVLSSTGTISSDSTGNQYIKIDGTRRWYFSGSDWHLRPYAGNTYNIGDSTNDVKYIYYCNMSDTSCADFSHLTAEELYNLFKQIKPRTDDIKHQIDNGMLFNHIDFATLPDCFATKAKEDFTKENVYSEVLGEEVKTTIDYKIGDNCGIEKGTYDYAMKDLLIKQYEMIEALELRIIELEGK